MSRQRTHQTLQLIETLLDTQKLTRGKLVAQAEAKLTTLLEHPYLALTSSGTGGIHVALLALGTQHGDEVITTSYTFSSSVNMILQTGARPVFVDMTSDFRIDLSQLEKVVSPRTKGILVTDLFGLVNDYNRLHHFAQKHRLWVVVDACQALGGKTTDGKLPISYADIVVSSFFETKHISTGEGGVILAKTPELLQRVHTYISHGQPRGIQYQYEVAGMNYRPTDLQAAVLLPQLTTWTKENSLREEQVKLYQALLAPLQPQLILPTVTLHDVPAVYPVQVPQHLHAQILAALTAQQLPYKPQYPKALHEYPVYASQAVKPTSLSQSEAFGKQTVLLLLGPSIDTQTIQRIGDVFIHVTAQASNSPKTS
ncbi:aminotransferase class V-fold PLP-dependent enzyme [Patescibacteria group bacterium]|nr:aminotransferase class V-fold PLP-dependent enzyme [Patescibacteria group bacterium]